ncbi:MAG: hypothetical protein QM648_07665 [Solirubrobacterales bacterium]
MAGSAGAAQTIGTTPAPIAAPLGGCSIPAAQTTVTCNVLQAVATGSDLQPDGPMVTSNGVLTSWHVAVATSGPATVTLRARLYRIADLGSDFLFQPVRSSAPFVVPAGGGQFDITDRVQALSGDYLGLEARLTGGSPGDSPLVVATSTFTAGIAGVAAEVPDNNVFTIHKPYISSNVKLVVSARIEPDVDGDGYGDETQDLCPQRADAHGKCTPPSIGALRYDAGGIRFTASTSGSVKVLVERATSGRKSGHRCKAGAHHGARCTAWLKATSNTAKFQPGANSVKFKGKRGKYRATLAFSAPGTKKLVKTLKFQIR